MIQLDLLFAYLIFAYTIFGVFPMISGTIYPSSDGIPENMVILSITDQILSKGHPTNWNSGNCRSVGIVENGRTISENKWNKLKNLSVSKLRECLSIPKGMDIEIDLNGEIVRTDAKPKGAQIETITAPVEYGGNWNVVKINVWR